MRHGTILSAAVNIIIKGAMKQLEEVMHKLFAIGIGIYLAGDPSLSMLSLFSESKELIVAVAIALVAVPWVTSHIDN